MVRDEKPWHVMLSPPCTLFSSLQNCNPGRGSKEWLHEYAKALELLKFSMTIAKMQIDSGRFFTFEHPLRATTWTVPCVREVLGMRGVGICELDMCAYGLVSLDHQGEGPAMKPTRLMSNSDAVLHGMPRTCPACARHVPLLQNCLATGQSSLVTHGAKD